ncbi:hypothetical protein IJI17_01845 [Candidatus Saccharibacteria bacterium]|nr:hypothetical protein [Candidatus Saccharibacteria bacterium]
MPYLVVEAGLGGRASAESVAASLAWGSVSLELDTEDDIEFGTITPTSATGENYGTMVVKKKDITVSTTGVHYKVYLSMASSAENNKLNLSANSSGDSVSSATLAINPVAGTWDSPVRLTSNTWGFAVPNTTAPKSETTWADPSVPEYPAFAAAYSTGTLHYGDPDVNSTYAANFSAVPLATPQEIYTGSFASSGVDHEATFSVYYGTIVDTNLVAGTYDNTISYTAIAAASSLDQVSHNIAVDKHYVGTGDSVTLSLDLNASLSSLTGTDFVVYVVPHSDVVADNYTVGATLTASLANGDYDVCAYDSVNLAINNGLTYTCTLPTETVDVDYDFWLRLDEYNQDYLTQVEDADNLGTYIGAVRYVGLQSTYEVDDGAGGTTIKHYVTKMQEMTPGVCEQTNRWNNRTGNNAQIMDPSGVTALPETEAGSDYLGVASFVLTDTRDQKQYLVRHLADGNCWMAENLDLDLDTVETLTSNDSDVTQDWTPDLVTITSSFVDATTPRFYDSGLDYVVGNSTTALTDASWNVEHASQYVGNYYNWYAATAGSGTSEMSDMAAPNSICPKGWGLPGWESVKPGSWYGLLMLTYAEGRTDSGEGSSWAKGSLVNSTSRFETLPISLVISGYYSSTDDIIKDIGVDANAWSRSAYTSKRSWHLAAQVHTNNTYTRYWSGRVSGFGIRCVAK